MPETDETREKLPINKRKDINPPNVAKRDHLKRIWVDMNEGLEG